MRITLSLVLTLGLGFGLAQPAWGQTKQTAWQRLTGVFKSKNQKDDAKKDDAKKEQKVEVRVSPPPTTAHEGHGVVFIEEPRTPTPQASGWAKTGRSPVISSSPAGQGASGPVAPPPASQSQAAVPPSSIAPPPIDVPPMQISQPKIVSATPVTLPKLVASPIAATSTSLPKIVESGPVNQPRIVAPPVTATPVTAPPVTATPVSQPKIVESSAPMSQPRIVAPPVTATPASYPKSVASAPRLNQSPTAAAPTTPAKTAKAPIAGRDVSRLTRQVSQACPKARNVKLNFTSATEVTVEMDVTTAEECNRHAEQIFAIRDLDPYRVNLKFNVPQN